MRICWIVLLMVLFQRLSAQPTLHAELSSGLSISYLSMMVSPANFHFQPLNKISYTLGLNLVRTSSQRKISWLGSIGLVSRATGIKLVDIPQQSSTITKYVKYATFNAWTLSAGVRIYLDAKSKYYFQPTVALLLNPDNVNFGDLNININNSSPGNSLKYVHGNTLGFSLSGELGRKVVVAKKVALNFSLLYSLGLSTLEQLISDDYQFNNTSFTYRTTNKGTYAAFIIGYRFAAFKSKPERKVE